jgi:hypothetical protein
LVIDPLSQSQNEPGRAWTGGSANAAGESRSSALPGSVTFSEGFAAAGSAGPISRHRQIPICNAKATSKTIGIRRVAREQLVG